MNLFSLILLFTCLICNQAEAEIKILEKSSIKNGLKIFVTTVCIDGYKFVVADGTTQFFEIKKNEAVPARCDTKGT